MPHLLDRNLPAIVDAVRSGETSAEALVQESLARAERASSLNCYLSLARESALETARSVDAKRERGEPLGNLAGVPIAIKDALCTRGLATAAASKILTRDGSHATAFRPAYDATAIERLRAEDAVIMGKTNMDEFAMGSSNENSAFGSVKNPWDPERTPGGSSGGSAAAVANRSVPIALGSDTGGSIRQPASHCGVVGVKPSYGRVSRYGLIAFASSLDQIGPFSTSVRASARVLGVIAGDDPADSTAAATAVGDYEAACEREVKGLRVGVPKEYLAEGIDEAVSGCVHAVLEELRAQGADVVEVSLPHTSHGIATYYIVATAEASSNLSRFDGVRFGLRAEARGAGLDELYSKTREQGFGTEVKRRIMLGTYALSSGYYDAYYKKAQQVRTLIRRDFQRAFEQVDLLVTPSSPTPAFRLGEKLLDPLTMYLADVYTLPASLAGIAGITVPAGFAEAPDTKRALPIGVQMLAPAFQEERLFSAAAAWERSSTAGSRHPDGAEN